MSEKFFYFFSWGLSPNFFTGTLNSDTIALPIELEPLLFKVVRESCLGTNKRVNHNGRFAVYRLLQREGDEAEMLC